MNNEIIPSFDDERDESLKITLEKINDRCVVLYLNGYIDTYNSLFFQSHVTKAIVAGFVQLIFECSNLTYVSSTGIGSFLIFLKTVKPRGGNAVLVNTNSKVYDVFRLLGFAQFFPTKKTVNEAVLLLNNEVKPAENIFPQLIECPICKRKLNITRPGRFRCASCKTILAVDGNAQMFLG